MKCYIEYLNAQGGFKMTRKDFKTFEDAKKWMLRNFEKPNIDYIKYY